MPMDNSTNKFYPFAARLFLLAVLSVMPYGCGPHANLAGTSSGVETKIARGVITDEHGTAAAHAAVLLIPSGYNPVTGGSLPDKCVDTTDAMGRYAFHDIDTGMYDLQAEQDLAGTMALHYAVHLNADSVDIRMDTLHGPGAIKILLSDNVNAIDGYIYIPGSEIVSFLNGNKDTLVMAKVPAGTVPSVCYSAINGKGFRVIRYDVQVISGDTAAITNPEWAYSRRLFFNTTPSGANVSGAVRDFPVLIRLTRNNFNFSQAGSDGSDLRFTKADNSPLPFEVERWDPDAGLAEVWVKADTVFGNDSSRFIMMYWGASTPSKGSGTSASNSASVFDTTNGFQGVWHMGQAMNGKIADATLNGYNGTPYGIPAASAMPGIIGLCQAFDGDSGYILMAGTAASKLNFPNNGIYTLSAWVYIDTLDGNNHAVVSKGDNQYNLQKYMVNDQWEFCEFKDKTGWEMTTSYAAAKKWTLVTGVRSGTKEYLFIDGVCADSIVTTLSRTTEARYEGFDFMVGRVKAFSEFSRAFFFNGKIDEVRASNVQRSADWIKLCFMNQRPDDKFVVFK
jgi:hypothetical protein